MSCYSKSELNYHRSIGLKMTNKENRSFSNIGSDRFIESKEEFEEWLSGKTWSDESKDYHRKEFSKSEGIRFDNGSFEYV